MKTRIYLDTSVISHLDAPDTPEKMRDTLRLWGDIVSGKYEVVISSVTLRELSDCAEPKKSFMLQHLSSIEYDESSDTSAAMELRDAYIDTGGLPPRSKDDALHIAFATLERCNAIVSWNFKHIVNMRAMKVVEQVNVEKGYPIVFLVTPAMINEEGE